MNKVINPFIVSGKIDRAYFCDRRQESAELEKALTNELNVVLTSSRRMGKTSLVDYVFDKPSSTVKAREVELHFIGTDGTTQISSGLQGGEMVVTAGVRFLSDGQKVKEVAKTSESNVGGLL